jgi:hypothetical protein
MGHKELDWSHGASNRVLKAAYRSRSSDLRPHTAVGPLTLLLVLYAALSSAIVTLLLLLHAT